MITGRELHDHLKALADQIQPEVVRLSEEKHWGEWWTLNGYLGILQSSMDSLRKHGRRALTTYNNEPRIAAIVGNAPDKLAKESV